MVEPVLSMHQTPQQGGAVLIVKEGGKNWEGKYKKRVKLQHFG